MRCASVPVSWANCIQLANKKIEDARVKKSQNSTVFIQGGSAAGRWRTNKKPTGIEGGRPRSGRRPAAEESSGWAGHDVRRVGRTSCSLGKRVKLDLEA